MDASPSSLELAARLVPQRASRSARRVQLGASAEVLGPPVPTTTTSAPPTTVVKQAAASPTPTAAKTTPTTHRRSTTTTTRKPRSSSTTTTRPPSQPSSPPEMRPWTPPTPAASTGQSEMGEATWYKSPDPAMCAHKSLPMGTVVTVVNLANNKTTTCKVGDRGPYVEGRIIDLSPEAFSQLAPLSEGVIDVRIEW
jgi:peptidoglycan lytic transglycosylase